jgi:hypothetical protein
MEGKKEVTQMGPVCKVERFLVIPIAGAHVPG